MRSITAIWRRLRSELLRFKESGKFVVAYNEVYSQPVYWLSSAADRVFIHPEGFMDWRGVAANVMFYKGLLDKLGVDVEIIRHGTFKSAVEPYITDRMSPANRLQMTTLVNSLWDVMLADISESRGIPADKLRQYAEEMAVREPDDALRFGFVDGVLYRDEMADMLSAPLPRRGTFGRFRVGTYRFQCRLPRRLHSGTGRTCP